MCLVLGGEALCTHEGGAWQTVVVGMGVPCMVLTVRAEGILSTALLKSFIYFISLKVLYIT